VDALRIGKNPMVMKSMEFKELMKSQFYPIGSIEEQIMKW
jgi:hypothetical protein